MQNNKQAAQEYVNHGFKLCAVRGKEPFQKGWEKKPITDLNFIRPQRHWLDSRTERHLYARHRQYRTLSDCISGDWRGLVAVNA